MSVCGDGERALAQGETNVSWDGAQFADPGAATAEEERLSRSGTELPMASSVIPATFSLMPSWLEIHIRFGQLYLTVENIQQRRTQSQRSRISTATQV